MCCVEIVREKKMSCVEIGQEKRNKYWSLHLTIAIMLHVKPSYFIHKATDPLFEMMGHMMEGDGLGISRRPIILYEWVSVA